MTTYEIVYKIIGPIYPLGDSGQDEVRHGNLEEMCDLVEKLLFDINQIAQFKESSERSVKKAGEKADKFLKGVKEV